MENKQIDEMAKAIEQARIKATDTTNSMNYGFGGWYAKELYEAGYRKASEVAAKIFAEIEKYNRPPLPECEPVYIIKASEFEELKRKFNYDAD